MVCKVFDYTAGATGNNEKQLKSQGRKYDKIYVHPGSHAGYYPAAPPSLSSSSSIRTAA